LRLPAWALPAQEDEPTGLGLTVSGEEV
jgi:hypothetical protein